MAKTTLDKIIQKGIADGVIKYTKSIRCDKKPVEPKKPRKTYALEKAYTKNDKVIMPRGEHYKEVPSTLEEGQTVRCTMRISKTCVYGKSQAGEQKCRYSLVTGHCRSVGKNGCSWKTCTKYSKISKDNPRLSCGCEE